MITFDHVTLQLGKRNLLDNATATIYAKYKVGLVGRNGSGKTTCFGLIRGDIQADDGAVNISTHLKIGYLAQEVPALEMSALNYVIDGDKELRAIEAELEITEDGEMIGHLHAQLATIDGYSAAARAAQLLAGLGFTQTEQQQPVKSFSGGWRMRLNLAATLMSRADILLLDEPTNHLDLDAIIWLEQWLKNYPGTVIVISHDRDFLDGITTHTIHIEHNKLKNYTGNYSSFENQRVQQLAMQQATYEKQQRQRAHMQSFVDRFRAKASKARQAQSRLKMLERMEVISAAQVDAPFNFEFKTPAPSGDPLLKMDHANLGYGEKTILKNVSLTITADARLGLLGPNGAGKSTFIKSLAGELALQAGDRVAHRNMKLGYFEQHQLDSLDLAASPLLHLQRIDPRATEQQLRNFLGGFDFRGDMALSPVGPFSGGEKTRLALALLIWQQPNLLLLDEPTNHLDLDMREALTMALQSYTGALVVVSHDRHLLRSTTDQLWLVANHQVEEFKGDLDDYQQWLLAYRRQQAVLAVATPPVPATPIIQQVSQRELETKLKKLDKQMADLNQQLQTLHEKLADTTLYDVDKSVELAKYIARQRKLSDELAIAEAAWLEITTLLESFN